MAPRKRDSGATAGGSAVQRRGRGRTVASDEDDAPGGLQPAQQSRGASPNGFTSRSPPPHGRLSLGGGAGGAAPPLLLAEQPLSQRIKSLRTRTRSTLLMVAGYIAVLYAGHVVVCLFIVCIQVRPQHLVHLCCPARDPKRQCRTADTSEMHRPTARCEDGERPGWGSRRFSGLLGESGTHCSC